MTPPAIARRVLAAAVGLAAIVAAGPAGAGAQAPAVEPLHQPLDELLDLYVRDGLVYYRTLRADRARLDRYLAALDAPGTAEAYAAWPRERQAAFWINAYNAFVLATVVEAYPIGGAAPQYPPGSIRQIPGAFERRARGAAGRQVTLDQIEYEILPAFQDPRLYLALGRGAVGGPRLRSEAFAGHRLEAQLASAVEECPTRRTCFAADPTTGRVVVTPVFGWHEEEYGAAYGTAGGRFAARSPIERALLALMEPHLVPAEREFLARDGFAVTYGEFDWALNDLGER